MHTFIVRMEEGMERACQTLDFKALSMEYGMVRFVECAAPVVGIERAEPYIYIYIYIWGL